MNRTFITYKVLLRYLVISVFFLLTSLTAFSEEGGFNPDPDFAQVESVRLVHRADGRWDVHTTVRHNDEGWGHYADAWQVVDSDTGNVIGERILAHPHDTEQPFTRSLTGLVIPEGIRNIRIRSRCSLHGYGGREISFIIPEDPEMGNTFFL